MTTVTNKNSSVYYSSMYWSDIPRVLEYICEKFTGNKYKWWVTDFKERYCEKPFERALSLNCGNGWVEREFIDFGIARQIVAFDYSMDLLQKAESQRNGRNITYFCADVNKVDFGQEKFDLIIDVAALHHVQFINRLSRILCETLTKDGLLVGYDYIGPERNQYPLSMWWYIKRFNKILPREQRRPHFEYPRLPTMLFSDPTEAIHSDLIIQSLQRYFEMLECHHAGGGIAYEILSQNPGLLNIPAQELNPYLDKILDLDQKFTREKKVPSLFAYFVARPEKNILANTNLVIKHQKIEDEREKRAMRTKGVYHYSQFVQLELFYFLRNVAKIIRFIKHLLIRILNKFTFNIRC